MQLRHLETFLAIADFGTLTEAARQLYKTQGAVSHDLKSLEQEFGLQLIDRSGQRAKLTLAGQYLLPHARSLLQRVGDIERTMREVGDSGHFEVRVGTLPSLARPVVRYVESFRRERENANFTFLTALRQELLMWLEQGRLDLLVVDSAVQPGVVSAEVGVDPIGVVIHRDLGRDLKEPVSADDVKDLPRVAFDLELGTTPGAEEFYRGTGRYPDSVVRVSDQHVMRQFVQAKAGYGVMPLAAAEDDDLMKLRTDPPLQRHIVVLRHEERVLSPLSSSFYDHLVREWRADEAREG
jgi:DNA-binding transcriptional LysR family regulator